MIEQTPASHRDALTLPLIACGAASLIHHVHNAIYLADYPGMPAWITPVFVYAAWLGAASLGIVGYLLRRRGFGLPGLIACAAYACYGLDGLAHYRLAPVSRHTLAMNLTIWLEVGAALVLLTAVARTGMRESASRRR